jgi:methionyl-tRNA synthetase
VPDYVQKLTTFPKGKYDDQIDSTAQAIKWITGEGREPNIIRKNASVWGFPFPNSTNGIVVYQK